MSSDILISFLGMGRGGGGHGGTPFISGGFGSLEVHGWVLTLDDRLNFILH